MCTLCVSGVHGVSEVAQGVRVLAALPDHPSLIPGIHRVEGEIRLLQVVL